ncbi:AAA family ATPase [Cryptosporangium phraense]|uniref:MoxR family ATPase n=1 Tax=Cryptosporangium phraense TaxID=2593070 RepID=A0A545AL11_9ACTN|nr:MoxR family ATPase [Cryptosporangium phraense]TQS41971.1 MoxR family ATPase [Cryptosporangium phraense]
MTSTSQEHPIVSTAFHRAESAVPPHDQIVAFATSFRDVVRNVEQAVHGKTATVELALICVFAQQHILIEDVPGVGKTLLARSLAGSLDLPCRRIQFTPDLLPADVTGSIIYDQRNHAFDFRPGPVFTNVLIADEINRASPRTQSALLEAMEEGQVTVDVESRPLPSPFLVVATENPIEMQGTYPLPEAQLDRFLIRARLDYPDAEAEGAILRDARTGSRFPTVSKVLTGSDVLDLVEIARRVEVSPAIDAYVMRLVAATRSRPQVRLGAGPRGSIGLMRASQVRAASLGRTFVDPDDVKALAVPVLAHRLLLSGDAERRATSAEEVIREIVDELPVPRALGLHGRP